MLRFYLEKSSLDAPIFMKIINPSNSTRVTFGQHRNSHSALDDHILT